MTIPTGDHARIQYQHGALIEYADVPEPLELHFEFNPTTINRTRSVTIRTGAAPGTLGGYDFENEAQAVRASQGVTVSAETFTVKILLDATDRMNASDPDAEKYGVQPEIDLLRSLVEPKAQGPGGVRTLAALGEGDERAFTRHQYASVLVFRWGENELPVFMTQAQIEVKEFLPNLNPYRAEATLTLQIIESRNPLYQEELKRQFASAAVAATASRRAAGGPGS